MKRDQKKQPSPNPTFAVDTAAAIFPNLHSNPQLDLHPHQSYSTPIHFHRHQQQHQPFPFQGPFREADDETSAAVANTATPDPIHAQPGPKENDGASIEVQRRPRGRPPGSKNKPKPPVIITREPDPNMSPYILEISNAADIIDAIAKFSRRRNSSLCVLSASGAVANVTIRQPSLNSSSSVTFHGRFDILSLSATFLASSSPIPANHLNVAISLSIPQGQIIGGIAAGPLTAAGPVFVVAASLSVPTFQRLPVEEETTWNINNTTASGGNDQQSPSPASGDHNINGDDGGPIFRGNINLASNVIWARTPRQPY